MLSDVCIYKVPNEKMSKEKDSRAVFLFNLAPNAPLIHKGASLLIVAAIKALASILLHIILIILLVPNVKELFICDHAEYSLRLHGLLVFPSRQG